MQDFLKGNQAERPTVYLGNLPVKHLGGAKLWEPWKHSTAISLRFFLNYFLSWELKGH